MSTYADKYGTVAQRAAELARKGWDPIQAWQSVVTSIFPNSHAYQTKSCPKSAFLALAEAGHIAGVHPGKYTTSIKNKRYALDALCLLQQGGPPPLADDLWNRVVKGASITHNGQMNVVIALWRARYFACQTEQVA